MLEGIICLIASIGCFVYSLFAFKQKGPLLTTMYYIANSEERAKMKTKKEYHFIAKTFLLISIDLAVLSIGEIFKIQWALKISIIVLIITVFYTFTTAIKDAVRK